MTRTQKATGSGLELEAGGNDARVIRVLKTGDTSKHKRALPDSFNIRLNCLDPITDE
jgi:hypothetical protein